MKENRTALSDCVDQSNAISNALTPVDNVIPEEMLTISNEIQPSQVLYNYDEKRHQLLSSEVVARNKGQMNKFIDKTSILDAKDKMPSMASKESATNGTETNEQFNFVDLTKNTADDNCSVSSELSIFIPTSIRDTNDKMPSMACMHNAVVGTETNEQSSFVCLATSSDDETCSVSSELSIFAPSVL